MPPVTVGDLSSKTSSWWLWWTDVMLSESCRVRKQTNWHLKCKVLFVSHAACGCPEFQTRAYYFNHDDVGLLIRSNHWLSSRWIKNLKKRTLSSRSKVPEYSIPTSQTFICKNRPNPARLTPRCTPSCRLRSLSCSCPRCWTCSRKVAAVSLDEVDTGQFFRFYQFFCSCPRLLLELIWPGKLQQHVF